MQELTYGIKITWQEPHLAVLMNQLLEWVRSKNEQLASLSLSVLVNICYKNLPSTYILTRLVDTKVFIDSLVKLQSSSNAMRVQLYSFQISSFINTKNITLYYHFSGSALENGYNFRRHDWRYIKNRSFWIHWSCFRKCRGIFKVLVLLIFFV